MDRAIQHWPDQFAHARVYRGKFSCGLFDLEHAHDQCAAAGNQKTSRLEPEFFGLKSRGGLLSKFGERSEVEVQSEPTTHVKNFSRSNLRNQTRNALERLGVIFRVFDVRSNVHVQARDLKPQFFGTRHGLGNIFNSHTKFTFSITGGQVIVRRDAQARIHPNQHSRFRSNLGDA